MGGEAKRRRELDPDGYGKQGLRHEDRAPRFIPKLLKKALAEAARPIAHPPAIEVDIVNGFYSAVLRSIASNPGRVAP